MTLGEVFTRYLLANLMVFSGVALFFVSVGVLIGFWLGSSWQRSRRAGVQVDDAHVLDVWQPVFEPYKPGVAKVGGK